VRSRDRVCRGVLASALYQLDTTTQPLSIHIVRNFSQVNGKVLNILKSYIPSMAKSRERGLTVSRSQTLKEGRPSECYLQVIVILESFLPYQLCTISMHVQH
jgi:hypothetical protein